MKGVFIVPTGVGAQIGGHAGDATPAAKLIAACCDKLFIHPNVVNASDINEMTENMIYVEGSILDRFLNGSIGLKECKNNKILVVVNEVTNDIINAVNAARMTIGADIELMELGKDTLIMKGFVKRGKALGSIYGMDEMIDQINTLCSEKSKEYDVVVVNSPIEVDDEAIQEYLQYPAGTNVWGGVEAMLSREASKALGIPVLHAPVENSEFFKSYSQVVDPPKAAEMVSMCYLHCCLKGAHYSPRIMDAVSAPGLSPDVHWVHDIDFLITPIGVSGPAHERCMRQNIPIIVVQENHTSLDNPFKSYQNTTHATSYLEAAGVVMSLKAGISMTSLYRPASILKVYRKSKND